MTLRELITRLETLVQQGLSESAIVTAFNSDEGGFVPVTVVSVFQFRIVEIRTDPN